MGKIKIIFIILFAVAASGFYVFKSKANEKQSVAAPVPVPVKVEPASMSAYCGSIEISGFLRGKNQADVAPKVAGRILKITKNEGEKVKAGEVIAIIDSQDAAVGVENSAQGIKSTEDVQKATQDYYDKLVKEAKEARDQAKKSGDDNAYDSAKAAYKSAQAARDLQISIMDGQKTAAEANLKSAQTQLSNFTLTAPFSGIVLHRYADPGAFVGPGNPILTVASPDELELVSSISQENADQLQLGQAASLANNQGSEATGKIIALSPAGDPASHRTEVRMSIDKNNVLAPGDFVRASFPSDATNSYLTIPQSSVFHRYDDAFVFAADNDGTAREKKVTLGKECQDRVAISGGLENNDQIITSGRENLKDGDKVEINYGK